jgi:peroxiredoxin
MSRLSIGDIAPDFTLPDHTGKLWHLADVIENRNALLVFNIGFA